MNIKILSKTKVSIHLPEDPIEEERQEEDLDIMTLKDQIHQSILQQNRLKQTIHFIETLKTTQKIDHGVRAITGVAHSIQTTEAEVPQIKTSEGEATVIHTEDQQEILISQEMPLNMNEMRKARTKELKANLA